MDIQRQAFEKAFKEQLGATHYQFDCDENGDYEDRETLCGWLMWQQAQKVAVPDTHILMPKEPTSKHAEAFWNNFIVEQPNAQTMYFAYKAMIEAQGQIDISKFDGYTPMLYRSKEQVG